MGWIFFYLSSSLILLGALPFTSLRSVTIGSGRDFLEGDTRRGQAQGLLGPVDPVPHVAGVVAFHVDAASVEVQVVRSDAAQRVST